MALAFAAEGATVALLDTNEPKLSALAEHIRARGGQASAVAVDLTHVAETPAAIGQVLASFGGRIDGLITTAGVCPACPWEEMLIPQALEQWQRLYAQNTLSALLPITVVWPRMKAQGGGVILTIASDLARQPVPEMLPYSTAKAALVHLTLGIAATLGKFNIRVIAVAPGPTRTAIWTREGGLMDFYAQQYGLPPEEAVVHELRCRGLALPRLTKPEEIAQLLLYLASPHAAAITRCVVDIHGGSHSGY